MVRSGRKDGDVDLWSGDALSEALREVLARYLAAHQEALQLKAEYDKLVQEQEKQRNRPVQVLVFRQGRQAELYPQHWTYDADNGSVWLHDVPLRVGDALRIRFVDDENEVPAAPSEQEVSATLDEDAPARDAAYEEWMRVGHRTEVHHAAADQLAADEQRVIANTFRSLLMVRPA